MPDDMMLSFVFITEDNQLGLANDTASRAAADQIADTIERFANFDQPGNRWGNGPEAVTEAALRKAGRDVVDQEAEWDDLVPPDLTGDGFDFLL